MIVSPFVEFPELDRVTKKASGPDSQVPSGAFAEGSENLFAFVAQKFSESRKSRAAPCRRASDRPEAVTEQRRDTKRKTHAGAKFSSGSRLREFAALAAPFVLPKTPLAERSPLPSLRSGRLLFARSTMHADRWEKATVSSANTGIESLWESGATFIRHAEHGWKLRRSGIIMLDVAVIHISEADAARDFSGLMARVRAGEHFVIESALGDVELVREDMAWPPVGNEFRPRLLSESIALAKQHAEDAK